MSSRAFARWNVAAAVLAASILGPMAAFSQQPPAPAVVVAPAAVVDLRSSTSFTGRLVAIQKVDIRARVTGFLERVNFMEGKPVKAGDVLYRIERGAYAAAVAETQGAIRSAEAEQRLAEIERDRKAQLVARQTVAQSELDVAEAQLGHAQGEVERLMGTLARAELDLSYTEIRAPFNGIASLSAVDVGALVGPDTGPLTRLTRLDEVQAEFPIATAILLDHRERVKRGEASDEKTVSLTLPNGTVYPLKGDINFVDASVSRGTDTVTVRASFANPDGVLPDGALVRVSIEQNQPQMVLTVPQQAVQRDQAGAFVMVVGDDSKVELRRVDVTRSGQGKAVIASGLNEGELVITEGVGKVRPGITVDAAQTGG
ncbi:MAG TPA: efflux RND transporter periplasmic adaptor subunit [Thermohalobaculum sp.]|nr:efflux RND transporter periplasmic adaptor subunit [Thermohalobaculum sp.]